VQKTATELWTVGVTVTITAIWRWNVDSVHAEERRTTTLQKTKWGDTVREAYERYKLRMDPVTRSTIASMQVAEAKRNHWIADERGKKF
jgi:hypothetical protein